MQHDSIVLACTGLTVGISHPWRSSSAPTEQARAKVHPTPPTSSHIRRPANQPLPHLTLPDPTPTSQFEITRTHMQTPSHTGPPTAHKSRTKRPCEPCACVHDNPKSRTLLASNRKLYLQAKRIYSCPFFEPLDTS